MQLPVSLTDSLKNAPEFNAAAFEQAHLDEEQITSIRFNLLKAGTLQGAYLAEGMQPVPWCSSGYYLAARPSFTFDPLFHAGLYYVQEASSMFLEQALRQSADLSSPQRVLDLCGAPGGKSTLMQSLLSPGSLLVSNDVIRARAAILEENLIKWGGGNVVVTNNDPKDFRKLAGFFDIIVTDAPCSGSGLFRRDPYLVKEWSRQNVQLCSERQQRILADVLPALREGGILIYSTCSYSVEEDEAIADFLIKDMNMETIRLTVPDHTGIVETISEKGAYGYRFYPDKVKGEGLYITALRLSAGASAGGTTARTVSSSRGKFERPLPAEEAIVKQWLKDAGNYRFIKFKNEVLAIPAAWGEDERALLASIYIKKAGTKIGEIINGALVPDHQLAVSGMVAEGIAALDLNEEDAIRYLKKETIHLRAGVKGWMLVRYRGMALGWVKALPNRVNNYYPKDWRIIKKER
ncbi:MAG: RNA methyltransferase [Chitinophagaceae bacterium]|nr:RNA methyltransferase [Chitinophagaceae bacterium]